MEWKDSGGGFEDAPVGTHIARCIKLIDIGTQQNEYQGKVSYPRQVIIAWELSNELMTNPEHEGKPFMVSRFYTASLNEKSNLRKDLINWRGCDFTTEELGGFSPKSILGATCMLSLTKNEKGNIKVSGVMALPKGTQVPPQVNKSTYFSLDFGQYDDALFESFSDGMKKIIQRSPEWQNIKNPAGHKSEIPTDAASSFDNFEDDIPF